MPKKSTKLRKLVNQNNSLVRRVESRMVRVPRGLGPITPPACTVKLPFAYSTNRFNDATYDWTFGTTLNLGITNAFSPISGTHQPYGFDQMAALYRFYKVVGFTYKVTAVLYTGSTAAALGVRPVPVNENSTLSATNLAMQLERPDTKVKFLVAGAGKPPSIAGSIDIPRLMGVSKEQFDADVSEYAALCTAAPSRYPYIQIAIAGVNNAAFAHVIVECVYIVNFWQRITQTQS